MTSSPKNGVRDESQAVHTVLVVDDDAQVRYLLGTLLQDEGFAVHLAASGKEALEFLTRESADLILLDINMPKMNGIAFLHQLKRLKLRQGIPVIVVSSVGNLETVNQAVGLGVNDFVVKPFDMTLLKFKVNEQLLSIGFTVLLEILERLKEGEHFSDLGEESIGYPTLLEVLRLKEEEHTGFDDNFKWLMGNQWGLYKINIGNTALVVLLDNITTLGEIKHLTKIQAKKKIIAFIEVDGKCECIWPMRDSSATKALLRSRTKVEALEKAIRNKTASYPVSSRHSP